MLTKSFNKNFSLIEQENLIQAKFIDSVNETIDIENYKLSVVKKNRFFYKKINLHEFLLLDNIFSNLKTAASMEASVFFDFNIADLKEPKKFLFANKIFFNPILNNSITISLKKIFNVTKENLMLDTSLFNVFYLNKKTVNHFSKLFLTDKYNLYLFKRKDSYYIFGLSL